MAVSPSGVGSEAPGICAIACNKVRVRNCNGLSLAGLALGDMSDGRPYFGAVLVGYHQDGQWLYAGKVGSGYNHEGLKSLHAEFMRRKVDACPFANLPTKRPRFGAGMTAGAMREVTWVKPELVCQVRFTEWTDDGMLRHPVFLGLRKDKSAKDVVREAAPIEK